MILGSKYERGELEELWQDFLWDNPELGKQGLCSGWEGRNWEKVSLKE